MAKLVLDVVANDNASRVLATAGDHANTLTTHMSRLGEIAGGAAADGISELATGLLHGKVNGEAFAAIFAGVIQQSIALGVEALIQYIATMDFAAVQTKVVALATKLWAGAQAALNVVLSLNPIGVIIGLVIGFAAGIYLLYTRSETFRLGVAVLWAGLQAAWDGIKAGFGFMKDALITGFRFIVDKFLGYYELLLTGAAKIFSWVPGVGDKLKSALEQFQSFREGANAALGGIHDRTVNVRINTTYSVYGNKGGHYEGGTFVPNAAQGGVVPPRVGGTLVRVAEAGEPEALVPLSRAPQFGFGGNGNGPAINVYVTQPLGTPEALALAIRNALRRAPGRGLLI